MCGGGDVPTTLLWLQQNGIPSAMCVDYAWCLNDPNCTGSGTDTKEMDKNVPSCGCYNSGNFYRYKIKDVKRISLDESNDQNPEQIMVIHSQIKQHLFVTGTMVGCFIVLENIVGVNPTSLKTGDFKTAKNPEGVYLECVGVEEELKVETPPSGNNFDACIYKYENEEAVPPEKTSEQLGILGAHAVCVVGWGMAPVSRSLIRPDIERLYPSIKTYEKDPTMVMVPYWWIRNSWGISFAEDGFFKMAAYPFNRVTCIDRSLNIKTDGRSISAGGSVLFFPDQAIRDSFPENDQKGRTPPASTEGGDKGGGDKGGVETGHFEGANKSAALGKAVAYTQLSYSAADDVLPQTGTYQAPTSLGPAQAQGGGEEKKVVGFEEETTSPPSSTSSRFRSFFLLVLFLLFIVAGMYGFCRYSPEKCPLFLRKYFLPSSIIAVPQPTTSPVITPPPPAPSLVPRVPVITPPPAPSLVPRVPVITPPPAPSLVPRVPVITHPPAPSLVHRVPVITHPPAPSLVPRVPVITPPPPVSSIKK
jgi:hypothetical protein